MFHIGFMHFYEVKEEGSQNGEVDEEGSHVSHKYLILLDNKLCIVKSYEFKFLQELIVQHDMVSEAY